MIELTPMYVLVSVIMCRDSFNRGAVLIGMELDS